VKKLSASDRRPYGGPRMRHGLRRRSRLGDGRRLSLMTALRRALVRAAPTCTLWEYDWAACCYRFVWCRKWTVTDLEIHEAA
jgi:hypothetical protein